MEPSLVSKGTDGIDDIRYSRQRYVLGEGAMSKLSVSSVFLSGFGALGVEIAKNLILTGIQKLIIHDTKIVTPTDLWVNYFINKTTVNKENRAIASLQQLTALNPASEIEVYTQTIEMGSDFSILQNFQCVILTEASLDVQIAINEFCRSQSTPIKFISADTFGVLGWIFCDFGNMHQVWDVDGEEPKQAFIAHITKTEPITVTLLDNQNHGLADGDFVTFGEVKGMAHLNGSVHKISQLLPSSFQIEHVPGHGSSEYIGGGLCKQVKVPTITTFEPLSKQLHNPTFVEAKDSFQDTCTEHLTFLALHAYLKKHNRLPNAWKYNDCYECFEISKSIDANFKWQINYELMRSIVLTASGILPPLAAFIGGVVAQEVLKAVTSKFLPLNQMLYFCVTDVLPDENEIDFDSISRRGANPLLTCIGKSTLKAFQSLNAFMVGCGAIGCEMLKNMALLNVATVSGHINVTDHDLVEKSNLTRQFLFRDSSIQHPKSVIAADAVHKFQPEMKITAHQLKVGPETEEEIFNDAFFEKQNVIISALDNVEGRRYLDKRCVKCCRPLLESGTMGTKGHVQVILPHSTESYSSQADPVDEDIPYCTLKSFPTRIEHTVQWARDKFESLFFKKPDIVKNFGEARHAMLSIIQKVDDGVSLDEAHQEMLKKMNSTLQVVLCQRPVNWAECLAFARKKYEKYFNHKAKQLLVKFPLESKLNNGSMFWQSPRRPPVPLEFDSQNSLHLDFIISTARLLASIWHIPINENDLSLNCILEVLSTVELPVFEPNIRKHIETDESIMPWMVHKAVPETDYETSIKQLRIAIQQGSFSVTRQIFEKDDDANGHIDFVTSASNLRAIMYGLEPVDRHTTRRIAGRIIPAIITTTSAIAALLTLELVKLVKRSTRGLHQNCFLNLAISTYVFSEPAAAPFVSIRDDLKFTLWDKWEIQGHQNFKLEDFIKCIEEKYRINVTMVLQGTKIIYMPFLPGHNRKLHQLMTELIKIPAQGKEVELSVGVKVGDDEEKSGPPVKYHMA